MDLQNKNKNKKIKEVIEELLSNNFKFTKDNVKYNIQLRFLDGSILINYSDEQYPIIPFAFEEYDIDYISKTMKDEIYQIQKGTFENKSKMPIKLLDKSRMNAKIMNNELKQNNNYTHLKNEIDELKKNLFF